MRCCFAFSLLLLAGPTRAAEPSLSFQVSGKPAVELTLSELEARVSSYTASVVNPEYAKPKSFACLPISAVMAAAFGPNWQDGIHTEAVLTALDGYASVTEAAKLKEDGGCLAFRDRDFPNWEPIGRKRENPGPFFLNWAGPGQSMEDGYPWPYQLAAIALVRFDERYPQVAPAGAKPGSPAMRGFALFKNRCISCHSINEEGGKVGPDLNAPRSVTSYRTKKWIKDYVRQPSKYRYTKMPDHLDLSDRNLDDLYQYFRWKARQPERSAGF